MGLALDYRPSELADVVGQKHVTAVLKAMMLSQQVPAAMIFGGSRGTGKTTTGRILAAALNCEKQNGDACGACDSCLAVRAGRSPSVLEVDAASNGGVDEVRRIRDMCLYAHDGLWRVVMLDEAHSMSSEAFNALLKLLEEPPANTVFVLLTTETDKILETVRSRSMLFEFRRISHAAIAERLRHIATTAGVEAADSLLAAIAKSTNGGMRDAVMRLDQVSQAGVSDVDGFNELFGVMDVAPELFTAVLESDPSRALTLVREYYNKTGNTRGLILDMLRHGKHLILASAGAPLDVPPEAQALLEAQAVRIPRSRLVRVMRYLWDVRGKPHAFEDDPLTALEVSILLLLEIVGDVPLSPVSQGATSLEPATAATAVQESPLSLSDVSALLGS